MRISSAVIAASLVMTGVTAGGASAATKPKPKPKPKPLPKSCNLVTDPAGDATGTGFKDAPGPNDASLDVISADVATDKTRLTAVFRLSELVVPDNYSPFGQSYKIGFDIDKAGQHDSVQVVLSGAGNEWAKGTGTGTVDTAKKEIRVTIPLASLSFPVTYMKTKLSGFVVETARWGGNNATTTPITLGLVDQASSTATYIAGYPSCVTVGA